MPAHEQHFFDREEEFLCKFSGAVTAAMQVLDGNWQQGQRAFCVVVASWGDSRLAC